jgi:hypothetical protein
MIKFFFQMSATSTTLGGIFNVTFPDRYIDCSYLRIHVLDVVNRADLSSYTTGFWIVQIYGSQLTNNSNSMFFFQYVYRKKLRNNR